MSKVYNSSIFLILLIGFSVQQGAFAQQQMLMLKSASGKTKEINISKLSTVKVTLPLDTSSKDCGATTYIGMPLKYESGLLSMTLKREVFHGMDKGMKINNEKKAERLKEPEISLDLADAGRITVNSKTAGNVQGLGRLLTTLGSITALIAAPLVSIQYSDGGFNSQRYYNVAGVGLAAVVVGVPLIYLAKPKTYVLKDFSGNEKELWSIQE